MLLSVKEPSFIHSKHSPYNTLINTQRLLTESLNIHLLNMVS